MNETFEQAYARQQGQSQDNGFHTRISRLESIAKEQFAFASAEIARLSERISWLERVQPTPRITGNELKAQQNVNCAPPEHLYAPLRNDTKAVLDLAAFARRLLDYDDLGQHCSAAVRDGAREALGLGKVES